jgi:hypothetical protein
MNLISSENSLAQIIAHLPQQVQKELSNTPGIAKRAKVSAAMRVTRAMSLLMKDIQRVIATRRFPRADLRSDDSRHVTHRFGKAEGATVSSLPLPVCTEMQPTPRNYFSGQNSMAVGSWTD